MNSCICSRCKNLISTIDFEDEEGNGIIESCEFGFPSETCITCELEGCDLVCSHFEALEEASEITATCSLCQKPLTLKSYEPGREVYCFECYFKK